ncbi:putative Spectrin repeat [Prochlorococcus marinus str. MIT 9302]|uniref:Putative Spectrin repeat n=1 Tax=Prochlorococcus marinus str. MIT 9302 TaxID=74545 RepID=A0A0A2A5X6_PROMR|nr:putative Spectrin repeat [Prochlorococcus marinus str. MIT 9302]
MYSMLDLLFETPSYRQIYVISDSEMKELKKNQHQEELNEIKTQRVRLEDAFKAQLKHLEEREKEVKKELKLLSASKNK